MVFNLQLFTTTWTFDSGVGFKNENSTIYVWNQGGRGLKGYLWDKNGAPTSAQVSGTNFSVSNVAANLNDPHNNAGTGVSTWAAFMATNASSDLSRGSGVSVAFQGSETLGDMVGFTDGRINLALKFSNGAQNFADSTIQGIELANTSTAQGYAEVTAIQLNGTYNMGNSTGRGVATNLSNSGGYTWDDTFTATGLSFMTDLRNNGKNLTVEIDRTSLSMVNVRGLNGDLKLVNTFNNNILVNDLSVDVGNARTITFGSANNVSMRSTDGQALGSEVDFTNSKYKAELKQLSNLTDVVVSGVENGDMKFTSTGTRGVLNFGDTSDSLYVVSNANNTSLTVTYDRVDYSNIALSGGRVNIGYLRGTQDIVVDASGDTRAKTLNIVNDNSQGGTIAAGNKVTINVGDLGLDRDDMPANEAGRLTLGLSGAGVESVNIGTHGANATASNWVMSGSTPTGAVSSNVVSIGDHGILAVEGDLANRNSLWVATHWDASGDTDKTSEKGDPSYLEITTKADGSARGANMGSYEYMNIAAQGNTYKAMVVSDNALQASDTNVNFGVDIVVGDMLNLGDRTDKKVVFLNNGLGKNDWGETVSYSANMTTVKSSTAGGSLIIGDFENSVSLYGAGDQDSLFGGNDYEHDKNTANAAANIGNYDTLASAAKKKAWMGTSDYSGLTMVDLVHNAQKTNNFGFLGENDETEKTGDVLALMSGAGFTSLKGSEHQLVNFAIGADSANHFMFQSITEGTHDIMYTYDLGKNNYNGRVDTSLLGSKSGFEYDDSIDFYLGFDKGTVLSFDSSDKNQKLNYDGGAVLMGISTIDGAAGGAGNILNGQENHAEYIAGSATAANTLCGGLKGDADTAADTLVGGSAADTFWVGATMGNDVINNVSDGDTIVFLNSKFADATITHNMLVPGDASVYNVSFSDEAGGATVNLNTVTGKKLSDFKSLTIKFDDATYAWNGTEWSQS